MSQEPLGTGVAWYDPFQWALLCKVATDPEVLHDSFADWELSATGALEALHAEGIPVVKVPVNVANLVAWCRRKRIANTSTARARYIAELVDRGAGGKL